MILQLFCHKTSLNSLRKKNPSGIAFYATKHFSRLFFTTSGLFKCDFLYFKTQKTSLEIAFYANRKRSPNASTNHFRKERWLFNCVNKTLFAQLFASTNSPSAAWADLTNHFTNSSRKGLLYVQVS